MPPKKAEWGHPDAALLEEIEEGAVYDGVVTNVNNFGVFVNFGAVKDALLRVPIAVKRGYKKGMALQGLKCISCDADAGKVVLQPEEKDLPEPPPKKPPQAKARAKSVDKRVGEGSNKPKKSWDHPEGRPLEEISVGDVVSGTVTNVSTAGVFLDIGYARDARLSVTTKVGRCFRVKDAVPECTVESFDLERGRVTVVLEDPEAFAKDLPPKERRAKAQLDGEAKGKAKAKPKAAVPKAKTAPQPPTAPREDCILIEELEEGAIVDGTVSNKSPAGVFVDIGCEKDARLNVPRKIGQQFMRGDEVYGMKIESVNLERNQISVILEDPQLEEVQMPAKEKPKAKAEAKAPAKREKAKVQKPPPAPRFRPGANADGIVTKVTNQGVYVDVGAAIDGLLKLPRALAQQFRIGDEVHGMEVESVDEASERVILSLEEPALEEPTPVAKPKPKAQADTQNGSTAPRKGGKGKGRGRV